MLTKSITIARGLFTAILSALISLTRRVVERSGRKIAIRVIQLEQRESSTRGSTLSNVKLKGSNRL